VKFVEDKMGTLKTREWKSRHRNAGVEIAGVEIAGEGKVSKAKVLKNVFLTILTENRVMILAAEQVSFASIGLVANARERHLLI